MRETLNRGIVTRPMRRRETRRDRETRITLAGVLVWGNETVDRVRVCHRFSGVCWNKVLE